MRICNINSEYFRKRLSELRKKYIILSSSDKIGYWRPNTKLEYDMFIDDLVEKRSMINQTLKVAKNERKKILV